MWYYHKRLSHAREKPCAFCSGIDAHIRMESVRSFLRNRCTLSAEYALPKAWNESIFPYTKNTAILHCPYAPEESLPTYAMNRRLKSVLSARIETPANTVMLFDSIPGKNLSGGREVLPDPPRHRNGDNNIGFVDGHAKSVSQKNLSFLLWTPHLTTIPYAPDMPMDKTFSSQAPTGK